MNGWRRCDECDEPHGGVHQCMGDVAPTPSGLALVAGAWVVYSWDMGYHVETLYADELEARRHAMAGGYQSVVFVPWGVTMRDAEQAARS